MSVVFVAPEHADILRQYLEKSASILIFPEAQAQAKACGLNDGDDAPEGYNFGGDPDVSIDKVCSAQHYLFQCVADDNESHD